MVFSNASSSIKPMTLAEFNFFMQWGEQTLINLRWHNQVSFGRFLQEAKKVKSFISLKALMPGSKQLVNLINDHLKGYFLLWVLKQWRVKIQFSHRSCLSWNLPRISIYEMSILHENVSSVASLQHWKSYLIICAALLD